MLAGWWLLMHKHKISINFPATLCNLLTHSLEQSRRKSRIKGKKTNTDTREDGHTEFCNLLPQMYDSSDASVHALHLLFPAKFREYVQKKDKRGHQQGLTEWKDTEDKEVSQTHRRPRLKLLRGGEKKDHTKTATLSLTRRERLLGATVQSKCYCKWVYFGLRFITVRASALHSWAWNNDRMVPDMSWRHNSVKRWQKWLILGIKCLVALSMVISILLSDFIEMIGFGGSKFYAAIWKGSGL